VRNEAEKGEHEAGPITAPAHRTISSSGGGDVGRPFSEAYRDRAAGIDQLKRVHPSVRRSAHLLEEFAQILREKQDAPAAEAREQLEHAWRGHKTPRYPRSQSVRSEAALEDAEGQCWRRCSCPTAEDRPKAGSTSSSSLSARGAMALPGVDGSVLLRPAKSVIQ
jgi:hypothetical protein